MKILLSRIAIIILLSVVSGRIYDVYGQAKVLVLRKPPIICYASGQSMHTYLAPPVEFLKNRDNPSARTMATSTFQVTYIGFPSEARRAFQYAVDIWQSVLISSVPIRIVATWEDLSSKEGNSDDSNTVLGSAGPSAYLANFLGVPKFRTYYPIALAEKLAQKDLNSTSEADINASFNSVYTKWYFGTDGKTPAGKTDLATVVLHEIGHGLGFSASTNVTGTEGSWGGGGDFAVPNIFDTFIGDEQGKHMVDTASFNNPSTALRTLLTSANVYFDSPRATAVNQGSKPKLYSPRTYNQGSSISHLDEQSYRSGDINSLMTPQIGDAEAILSPGPLLLNVFADMGWRATYIQHTPFKDTENTTAPLTFRATIASDDALISSSPELHYTIGNEKNESTVKMSQTAGSNEYAATIPSPGAGQTVRYYLSVSDNAKQTYTAPGGAPAIRYEFAIGPDTLRPVIAHAPITFVLIPIDSIPVNVLVSDNIVVDTVYVEYLLNELPQSSFPLRLTGSDEALKETSTGVQLATTHFFTANFLSAKTSFRAGDRIRYRIVARDASAKKNQVISPANGYYSFNINTLALPRTSYYNSFNTPTEDFVGNNFSITTPAGFADGAIHSDHPYQNGSGPNDESNYTFQLLTPIIVKNINATLSFDEIALVEPGEDNSVFGEPEFFDYVVVEGSKNKGITWQPLEPGYDSRYNAEWLNTYLSHSTGDNSTATGRPELYRTHTMDLLNAFEPRDTILIRFRLFADQGAHGWGWSVDNLNIQSEVTGNEPLSSRILTVFPSPTTGFLTVEARLQSVVSQVDVSVSNALGMQVLARKFENPAQHFAQQMDLRSLLPGLYFINVQAGPNKITRKIIVAR